MNVLEELQSHISQVDQQLVDLQKEVEVLSQEVRKCIQRMLLYGARCVSNLTFSG